MKIIDLLNKIANGEEPPKKIYYKNEIFEYDEKEKDYVDIDFTEYLFDDNYITDILNDEVKILDEPKLIDSDIKWYFIRKGDSKEQFIDKINVNFKNIRERMIELIDEVNKLKESDK